MENIFCIITGAWYMELKVKEFCVFYCIEQLFSMACFKRTILKNIFCVFKVYMLEVPVFVTPMTEHLMFDLFQFVTLCV